MRYGKQVWKQRWLLQQDQTIVNRMHENVQECVCVRVRIVIHQGGLCGMGDGVLVLLGGFSEML